MISSNIELEYSVQDFGTSAHKYSWNTVIYRLNISKTLYKINCVVDYTQNIEMFEEENTR